jgi:hypothetical protein
MILSTLTDQEWLFLAAAAGVALLFWGFIYRTPRL